MPPSGATGRGATKRRDVVEFGMMVEEHAISLFAQQAVETRYPVSEVRLRGRLHGLVHTPPGKRTG